MSDHFTYRTLDDAIADGDAPPRDAYDDLIAAMEDAYDDLIAEQQHFHDAWADYTHP